MQQALYVLWKQGASAAFFLQLRDSAYDPSNVSLIGFQTGVYFHSEKPKPSLRAVQFPFVADRKNENKVVLWGKAPQGGKLVVEEKKGGGFRTVARINVSAGGVFKKNVRLRGKHTLRAVVGAEKSLNWKLKS